ncbi:hypothetical protein J3F83DRAFT_729721 [Trichoderma novae-zelandiae]
MRPTRARITLTNAAIRQTAVLYIIAADPRCQCCCPCRAEWATMSHRVVLEEEARGPSPDPAVSNKMPEIPQTGKHVQGASPHPGQERSISSSPWAKESPPIAFVLGG